ncbi:hypothetical protein DFH09DRAFT_160557 [Mycena vulgaris]|nr:hypothetical protein DFH09DRAFT_160557 [Mycena vulgaris]
MSALPGLPVEILGIIAEISTTAALVPLCQTNRRIHAACFRHIYRTVNLESLPAIVKCFQTFNSNAAYAEEVRSLKILCSPKWTLRRFGDLIQSAMSQLKNVEIFFAQVPPSLFPCFSLAHFPRLRECVIPGATETGPFLRRHGRIVSLVVLPQDEDFTPIPSPQRVHMPALCQFGGPEAFALALVPNSRVSRVFICWQPHRTPAKSYADVMATLALSETYILSFTNAIHTWDTSLLSAIVAGMPHLTSLTIENPSAPNSALLQIFISHLDAVVTGLPHLMWLSIGQGPFQSPDSLDPRDLQWEFNIVRQWGAISPTLRCVSLPSETVWTRVQKDVWYPATTSPETDRSKMLVRAKWFLTLVASSSDLCAAYTGAAETVAGKEIVRTLREAFEREGRLRDFQIRRDAAGMSISFAPG